MVASADSGSQIDKASMAAKIEAPSSSPTSVTQGAQPSPQVASADKSKGASPTPNPDQAQSLYKVHLATARA